VRQAGLGQHPGDGVTVHAQLRGNRSDPPAFSVVIAQDLRLEIRGNGHDDVLFDGSTGPRLRCRKLRRTNCGQRRPQ
jgi:hypothetical protein